MPVSFEIEFDDEQIRQLAELTQRIVRRAQELTATDVWGNIGREAPTDHGKLAGEWSVEPLGATDWRIYTNTEYAKWVHDGTGIHGPTGQRIVPRNAPFLVFEWQGRTWRLRSVAGQKPNPYADRAITQTETRTQEFIDRAMAEMGV